MCFEIKYAHILSFFSPRNFRSPEKLVKLKEDERERKIGNRLMSSARNADDKSAASPKAQKKIAALFKTRNFHSFCHRLFLLMAAAAKHPSLKIVVNISLSNILLAFFLQGESCAWACLASSPRLSSLQQRFYLS